MGLILNLLKQTLTKKSDILKDKNETNTKTETKRQHEERGLKTKGVALVAKFENKKKASEKWRKKWNGFESEKCRWSVAHVAFVAPGPDATGPFVYSYCHQVVFSLYHLNLQIFLVLRTDYSLTPTSALFSVHIVTILCVGFENANLEVLNIVLCPKVSGGCGIKDFGTLPLIFFHIKSWSQSSIS